MSTDANATGGLVLLMRLITGFNQQHLLPALALMLLEASVMLSVVIAGGVRFTLWRLAMRLLQPPAMFEMRAL